MRHGLMFLGAMLLATAGCPAEDDTADDSGGADSTTAGAQTSGPGGTDTSAGPGSGGMDASATSSASGSGSDSSAMTGTTDGATTGGSLCGRPIAGLDSALGILVADYPDPPGGGTGGTTIGTSVGDSGGSGGGIPGDTMRLRFANSPLTCEDPYGNFECEAFDKWWLTIHLPVDVQAPGTYDIADLDLGFSFVAAGAPPTCAGGGGGDGGGGGGFAGQLIIEQFDADGIVGCIDGTDFFDFDANGSFSAVNCSP